MNLQWLTARSAANPAQDSVRISAERDSNAASRVSLLWDGLLPGQTLDNIVRTMETEATRVQCLGEIAYLRGDFARAKHFAADALKYEPTYISASLFLLFVAITTDDFALYSRVELSLKRRIGVTGDSRAAVLSETVLATVAVSMFAPALVPEWLKEGDFSRLPLDAAPFALYLRVKYLQNLADYRQMSAVAQTMLTLCKGQGVMMEIYLLLMCAAACVGLGDKERARTHLLAALALGMPYGFVTPFVENLAPLGGLVEECVQRLYPQVYDSMIHQWENSWKSWAVFHNRFARDHVTLLLTLREFRIATLASNRIPYAEIARQECLSVGRIRNIIQEIYGKLFIRSRDELAALVLWTPKKT